MPVVGPAPSSSVSTRPLADAPPSAPAAVLSAAPPGVPQGIHEAAERAMDLAGLYGPKVTRPELGDIQAALDAQYGPGGAIPRGVVDYLVQKLQGAPQSGSVRRVLGSVIAGWENRVGSPDLPPPAPVDPTPPPAPRRGFGFKVDFSSPELQARGISSYAELFGQDVGKPNYKPYYRLGGESFFPAEVKTAAEREAYVERLLVPYDRAARDDGRHGFAKLIGGAEGIDRSGIPGRPGGPAPNFLLGGGIYGSDHLTTPLDAREVLAKAAEGQAALGAYLQPKMQDILTHWPFSHTFRVTVQDGVATQNSAPPGYMNHGNFDTGYGGGGDYENIVLYKLRSNPIEVGGQEVRLTDRQLELLKVAGAATDNIVSKISSAIGFNSDYEGGQTLDKAEEVQLMAGLGYLLTCSDLSDKAADKLRNGPDAAQFDMFCAMAGGAAVAFPAVAPPTPSGIRAALERVAARYPDLGLDVTDAVVKDVYNRFWTQTNQGELVNNGNEASEGFRFPKLTDADLKPIHVMLAENAGRATPFTLDDLPEGGLPFPRMTAVDYVATNVARQLPMDYTTLNPDDAVTAQARGVLAMAIAPEVMKRAGLFDSDAPEVQALKGRFEAGLGKLQVALGQSATAASEDDARKILDPVIQELSAIALESNRLTGASQALALPPGAYQWLADAGAHLTGARQSYLALETAAVGVDASLLVET